MPRKPRLLSDTGIYHVMVRGINKRAIFKTSGEKEKYLDTIGRMNEEGEFSLYGYCIMDNHAHLLIKEEADSIDLSMKRIGVSYAYYYNNKYDRVGPLFQGRFRSERIETEDYLLSCLRYIHNNPVKAKLAPNPAAYRWSSYNSYISKYLLEGDIIARDFILGIYSNDRARAIRRLIEFTKLYDDYMLSFEGEMEDNELETPVDIIQTILSQHNLKTSEVKDITNRELRDYIIAKIATDTNISSRDLAEIIGISKSTIARIAEMGKIRKTT